MADIIDGKAIAKKITEDLQKKIAESSITPGLAIIKVGNNPASEIYVSSKEKKAHAIGFKCARYNLEESVDTADVIGLIEKLNSDNSIHGMIVQLPLPDHMNEQLILDAIIPEKDADGFTPLNLGNLMTDNNILVPATARANVELIKSTGVEIAGKHAVVVGRSTIVGKPTALLLLQENATVSICHSKTKDLAAITKQADILVVSVGRPKLVSGDMVKEGAVVIDVGISRTDDGLCGDVDFESAKKVAAHITPVPGGVGPMTIAMLLQNTYDAAQRWHQ